MSGYVSMSIDISKCKRIEYGEVVIVIGETKT